MLGKSKNRYVSGLAWYDDQGVRRIVREMRVAVSNRQLRLVYKKGVFLIVYPETLWMAGIETKEINVLSNTNWLIN